jgi:uncharacterized protein YbjT (DUF2867 family)
MRAAEGIQMILVAGASGNVGGALVRALASADQPVRALTRGGGAGFPPRVESVAGDLNDPASLRLILRGVDGLFLLPGYAEMSGVLAEARRAGVDRVVQLSGMSAGMGDMSNAITRYMTESEKAARESGLSWTVLRPAAFMSNTLQWLPQLRAGDVVRAPFAQVRAAVIDPADIAAVAALALIAPGHEGQVHLLSGPQSLAPADRVAILSQVLGRNLRFAAQPDDEARAEMNKTTPAEYVDAFFRFYSDGTLDESRVLSTVEELTGQPPRPFSKWAAEHADSFA